MLPLSDAAVEDFQWVRRDLVDSGGEATMVEAHLVEGLSDGEVETLFREARDTEYREVATELRALAKRVPAKPTAEQRAVIAAELGRLEQRIEEIGTKDFFLASGREVVAGLLSALKHRVAVGGAPCRTREVAPAGMLIGRAKSCAP